MTFIERERTRINILLARNPDGPDAEVLRVAQQALAWAQDPVGFASPYDMITGSGNVQPAATPTV